MCNVGADCDKCTHYKQTESKPMNLNWHSESSPTPGDDSCDHTGDHKYLPCYFKYVHQNLHRPPQRQP